MSDLFKQFRFRDDYDDRGYRKPKGDDKKLGNKSARHRLKYRDKLALKNGEGK